MLQKILPRRLVPIPFRDGRQIHSAKDFRWVLHRERARADRSERAFSLLLFATREPDNADEPFQPLLQALIARLRCYDEIGYFDQNRLAVLLPDTDARGAWKVADDVLAAYPTDREPPHCEVYLYPSDWSALDAAQPVAAGWEPFEERPVKRMESLFVRSLPRWKRYVDIAGALFGLTVLSPLIGAAAVAVRLSSPGPVLFRQWRTGEGNRRFVIYKFRTMYVDAELRKEQLLEFNEQDGPAFKIKRDPRITRIGRLLRRTSIDELPQFWNVLKGEMSLVGPRPLPCDEADACHPWQKRRLDVMPGLTCIWQVRGRSQVRFDEWVRMDIEYVQRRSMLCDFSLLAQTALAVVRGRGAH